MGHLGEDGDPLHHVSTVTWREGTHEAMVVELGTLLPEMITLDSLDAAGGHQHQPNMARSQGRVSLPIASQASQSSSSSRRGPVAPEKGSSPAAASVASQAVVPHESKKHAPEVKRASLSACSQERLLQFLQGRGKATGSQHLPVRDWLDDAPLPPGDVCISAMREAWKAALKGLQKQGHLKLTTMARQPRTDLGAWTLQLLDRSA